MDPAVDRSIRHLTYPYSLEGLEGRGLDAKLVSHHSRVMAVLFCGRGMCTTSSIEPEKRYLHLLGAGINVEDAASKIDTSPEMPGFNISGDRALHDFKEGCM